MKTDRPNSSMSVALAGMDMNRKPRTLRPLAAAIVAIACLMVAGCAVGPDFKRPAPPAAEGYTPTPLGTTAAAEGIVGAAQRFDSERDIPAEWWTLFRSRELNALIERAYRANPTIEAAQAALRRAQENVYAQRGYFFPTVQASYSPSRIKISGNTNGGPGVQGDGSDISTGGNGSAASGATPPYTTPVIYNWHTAQLTVGYVPDVFGGYRRQLESLTAQAAAQRFELEATYITLASNVAAAAIQEASLRAQIAAVKNIIDISRMSLDIMRQQFRLGYIGRIELAAQEDAVAQAEALLPPLELQFEQTRNLIRVLVGNTPDQDVAETFRLEALHLPEELPLSLPSKLVRQRPDVRAAEELLHAASAEVGVAVAARLPQFSIEAAIGGNAAHFGNMFQAAGTFFSVAGAVSQTLFAGGTLMHHQRAAEQALAEAAAQYRSTVLTAFQNVADTLRAIHTDADALKAAMRSEQAAKVTLDLTRKQQEVGYVNYLSLLAAEQSYQAASIALVQARASRLGNTAALFQSLGGGWWNRKDAGRTDLDDSLYGTAAGTKQ